MINLVAPAGCPISFGTLKLFDISTGLGYVLPVFIILITLFIGGLLALYKIIVKKSAKKVWFYVIRIVLFLLAVWIIVFLLKLTLGNYLHKLCGEWDWSII